MCGCPALQVWLLVCVIAQHWLYVCVIAQQRVASQHAVPHGYAGNLPQKGKKMLWKYAYQQTIAAQITGGISAYCNAMHKMCLEVCIYMSHARHTMRYSVSCHDACVAADHWTSSVPQPLCFSFVCLQDLKKKEGGGDGKAEELTDGTATKAGKHKLVMQMLSFCTHCMATLGQDTF